MYVGEKEKKLGLQHMPNLVSLYVILPSIGRQRRTGESVCAGRVGQSRTGQGRAEIRNAGTQSPFSAATGSPSYIVQYCICPTQPASRPNLRVGLFLVIWVCVCVCDIMYPVSMQDS